jgi:hypothetical protein
VAEEESSVFPPANERGQARFYPSSREKRVRLQLGSIEQFSPHFASEIRLLLRDAVWNAKRPNIRFLFDPARPGIIHGKTAPFSATRQHRGLVGIKSLSSKKEQWQI